MTAQQFVEIYDDLDGLRPDQFEAWDRVFRQAIEHTRHVDRSELIDKARPNEPENITKYRNDNKRRITKADVEKYRTKVSRIYKSSGFAVNQESLSDVLIEHLDSMPYDYLGSPADLTTYLFDCVYPRCIDDPNSFTVEFPFNPENPAVPPTLSESEGGLPSNRRVSIETIYVPYDRVSYVDRNIFAFVGGNYKYTDLGKTKEAKFYWIIDKEWWYIYYPVGKDKGKVKYELAQWYRHDTGMGDKKLLPVNMLPGTVAFDQDNEYMYQESLLQGYFVTADEAMSRFSDGQGVWVNFSSPVKVVAPAKCHNPSCNRGKVPKYGKDGNQAGFETCHDCGGSGSATSPSPYGVFVKQESKGLDEKVELKPYEIISPPSEAVKTSYELPFDLLEKARKAIGLDVLLGTNESGKAKEKRLEDTRDKLSTDAERLKRWLVNHLFFKECLLQVNRATGVPSVNTPVDFDLKDSSDLREDVINALSIDKLEKTLIYIESQYENNPSIRKQKQFVVEYSALFFKTDDEVIKLTLAGLVDEIEVVKRNYANAIFRELAERPDWMVLTKQRAFELADEWIRARGLQPVQTIEIQGDE